MAVRRGSTGSRGRKLFVFTTPVRMTQQKLSLRMILLCCVDRNAWQSEIWLHCDWCFTFQSFISWWRVLLDGQPWRTRGLWSISPPVLGLLPPLVRSGVVDHYTVVRMITPGRLPVWYWRWRRNRASRQFNEQGTPSSWTSSRATGK